MKTSLTSIVIAIGVAVIACTPSEEKSAVTQNLVDERSQKATSMENFISIVEIPVKDFTRAVNFYQALMQIKIEVVDMAGTQMGVWPNAEGNTAIALVKGSDYQPSTKGTLVYLNAGENLDIVLDKAIKSGAKLLVAKTEITPEMGFFAIFEDTEGNKIGLHALK